MKRSNAIMRTLRKVIRIIIQFRKRKKHFQSGNVNYINYSPKLLHLIIKDLKLIKWTYQRSKQIVIYTFLNTEHFCLKYTLKSWTFLTHKNI